MKMTNSPFKSKSRMADSMLSASVLGESQSAFPNTPAASVICEAGGESSKMRQQIGLVQFALLPTYIYKYIVD